MTALQYVKGCYKQDSDQLFPAALRMGQEEISAMHSKEYDEAIRKDLLTIRIVKHLNRLLRQVVASPSLVVVKGRLDERSSRTV